LRDTVADDDNPKTLEEILDELGLEEDVKKKFIFDEHPEDVEDVALPSKKPFGFPMSAITKMVFSKKGVVIYPSGSAKTGEYPYPAPRASDAEEMYKCSKCEWTGSKDQLKDGKCPKCEAEVTKVTKTTDSITDSAGPMMNFFDAFKLNFTDQQVTKLEDGSVLVEGAEIMASIPQKYFVDGKMVTLMKDAPDIKAAMAYLDGMFVCDGHPADGRPVSQADVQGKMFNSRFKDGKGIVDFRVWPGKLADAVLAGKRPYVSVGGDCFVDWTPGEFKDSSKTVMLDGYQRDLLIHHIGLLDSTSTPRCPPPYCKIPTLVKDGTKKKKATKVEDEVLSDETKQKLALLDKIEQEKRCEALTEIHKLTDEKKDVFKDVSTPDLMFIRDVVKKGVEKATVADGVGVGKGGRAKVEDEVQDLYDNITFHQEATSEGGK
jgi:hypothetical protein